MDQHMFSSCNCTRELERFLEESFLRVKTIFSLTAHILDLLLLIAL